MVRYCVYPNCPNKMTNWTKFSFHRLPLRNPDLLKLWLVALKMDPNTEVEALSGAHDRVCSAHFTPDDFSPPKSLREGQKIQRLHLRKDAVPMVAEGTTDTKEPLREGQKIQRPNPRKNAVPMVAEGTTDTKELQDTWKLIERPPDKVRSVGIQVNVPNTCAGTMEKPTLHHVVDEEAIMQLVKNCPMCNKQCRCSRQTRGPYLIVYQNCYFCHYQRKWASQPEAKDMNQKAHAPSKRRRQPKDKASAKAQSSQRNRT